MLCRCMHLKKTKEIFMIEHPFIKRMLQFVTKNNLSRILSISNDMRTFIISWKILLLIGCTMQCILRKILLKINALFSIICV